MHSAAQWVPGRACQCNVQCPGYNNCCSDYQEVCRGSPPIPPPAPPPPAPPTKLPATCAEVRHLRQLLHHACVHRAVNSSTYENIGLANSQNLATLDPVPVTLLATLDPAPVPVTLLQEYVGQYRVNDVTLTLANGLLCSNVQVSYLNPGAIDGEYELQCQVNP